MLSRSQCTSGPNKVVFQFERKRSSFRVNKLWQIDNTSMSIFDFCLLWAICWDSEKALYIMVSDKRWAHKIYSKTTSHCFNLKEKQKTFRYFLPTANFCIKTTGQYYPILNVWGGFPKKSKSKTLSFVPCDSSSAALDSEKFNKNSPRNTGCFFSSLVPL